MKKFLKFFPVALAAFALASCSSDDLSSLGGDTKLQKDPTKLYAQIEDLTDGETKAVTRSGFVYSYDAETPNGQVFVWTEDDKVKLYDNENNWRPQIWTYDEDETLAYSKDEGFAVFTQNTTTSDLAGQVTPVAYQYTNAYGVMPYTLSEFVNEYRTEIKFDFSELAYYETGLTAEDAFGGYTNAKLSKAPIPLWGVANGNEMKVKYLTGILKVDINNIENTLGSIDAATNTHQFLIIQSKDAATPANGFYMHPSPTDIPTLGTVTFDPDDVETAPVVASNGTGATATDLNAVAMATTDLNAPIPNDLIIIDLGDIKGRVCVSVPLMPGHQLVKAYVKKDVSVADPTSVNLQNPTAVIDAEKEWNVQPASYYRIQDPGLVNVSTLNNPYSVAQYIAAHDAEQTRDWTLKLGADVDVKTGGAGADPNNYVLDLTGYTLKHNVTIEFATSFGFKKNATGDKLVIKTAASTNDKYKLTVVNNNNSTIEIVTVDASNAGPVVLEGDFATTTKTINIDGPKVTLKNIDASNAASIVNAKAPFAIDATNPSTSNSNIKTVNLATGCTGVNLLNGNIDMLKLDATDKIAADVEIYSEGLSYFKEVSYQNMPTTTTGGVTTNNYKLNFSSKFTDKLGTFAWTQIDKENGAATCTKAILTCAQLAAFDGTGTGVNARLIGKFDLNGSEMTWTALPYSASCGIIGSSTKLNDTKYEGQAEISNLRGAQGLFSTITPGDAISISGIKFTGTNEISANVSTGLGLLAGSVTGANALTLKNITVEGVTVKTPAGGKHKNVGGLIGIVNSTSTVTLMNVNVTASLQAYANLGGIIGQIQGGTVNFAAANAAGNAITPTATGSYATAVGFNSANATFTLNYDATDFSDNYATKGQFAGKIAAGAKVTVAQAQLPPYENAAVDALAKWVERDTDNDPIRRNIVEKQTFFGFSGITNDETVRYLPIAETGWHDVIFYGGKNSTTGAFNSRTYEVKNASPVSPAEDSKYFLNYVADAE